MALSRAEAARIAELARLHVPESELDRLALELSTVLDFAATLNDLELGDEPLTAFAPAEAPLRIDGPDGRTLNDGEDGVATANAPEAEAGFFLVPPVVEDLEP
jgi:aspartyl-tRNA(Asn)/glutamyl-tRNA(Gln) amidotransferase subunit C